MTLLLWVAVLVGGWCVTSVVAALTLGTFLRRRHQATDPDGALRPLAVGPMDFWAGTTLDIPDTPAELGDVADSALPVPRAAADEVVRDSEAVT